MPFQPKPFMQGGDLAQHVVQQLQDVAQAWEDKDDAINLNPLPAEPKKPRDGMVVLAASPWNPGSGPGLYVRINGAWVAVGPPRHGVATLVAGTVNVTFPTVTATSLIYLTSQFDVGTPGWLRVTAQTAGVGFTITSSSATDGSLVAYQVIER